MKVNLISFATLLFCILSAPAIAKPIYFDAHYHKTSKKRAVYYREVKEVKAGISVVEDYYISGQLYMSGYYETKEQEELEGIWADVLRTGYFTYYYPSGALMMKGQYKLGQKDQQWVYYYDSSKQVKELGGYVVGNRVGEWKSYYRNGKLKQRVTYRIDRNDYYDYVRQQDGDVVKDNNAQYNTSECYNIQGELIPCEDIVDGLPIAQKSDDNKTEERVFVFNDEMPTPGYNVAEYLAKHIRFPNYAKDHNKQGKVLVAMDVNKDGKLTNIHSLTPYVDASLQMEALRVVSEMPDWEPVQSKLKVKYVLPIIFKLE